jgi:hypothetical protein
MLEFARNPEMPEIATRASLSFAAAAYNLVRLRKLIPVAAGA